MTNAEKYLKDGVDIDELTFCFDDWHFKNSDVKGYGEALFRFFQSIDDQTLTEDEKVILKFIENFDYIGRDEKGLYYKLQDENIKEKTAVIYNLTTNLFQFIREEEEYSIEELLKDDRERKGSC